MYQTTNEMAKKLYDNPWISKRIIFLIDHKRLEASDLILKVTHCDPEYIDEVLDEANEIIEHLTYKKLVGYFSGSDIDKTNYHTFITYACAVLQEFVFRKMKLKDDSYIESVVIKHVLE